MSEENEKYPQIVLGTDGSYQLFISKGVEVKFKSKEDIDEFVKDKNFFIIGVEDCILTQTVNKNKRIIFEALHHAKS